MTDIHKYTKKRYDIHEYDRNCRECNNGLLIKMDDFCAYCGREGPESLFAIPFDKFVDDEKLDKTKHYLYKEYAVPFEYAIDELSEDQALRKIRSTVNKRLGPGRPKVIGAWIVTKSTIDLIGNIWDIKGDYVEDESYDNFHRIVMIILDDQCISKIEESKQ